MPDTPDDTTDLDILEPEDDTVRPFADFLLETNRGTTHAELSEYLQQLVRAVSDTGKKGSLGLVITIEPIKGDDHAFSLSDKIILKLPEHDRGSSMFFKDHADNLRRQDPRQLVFESLREVPAPKLKVSRTTGEVTETAAGQNTGGTA